MWVKEETNHEETVFLKQFYNAENLSVSLFLSLSLPSFLLF